MGERVRNILNVDVILK